VEIATEAQRRELRERQRILPLTPDPAPPPDARSPSIGPPHSSAPIPITWKCCCFLGTFFSRRRVHRVVAPNVTRAGPRTRLHPYGVSVSKPTIGRGRTGGRQRRHRCKLAGWRQRLVT